MSKAKQPAPAARKVIVMDKGYGGEIMFQDTRDSIAWCGDSNGHGIKGYKLAKLIADMWNQNAERLSS